MHDLDLKVTGTRKKPELHVTHYFRKVLGRSCGNVGMLLEPARLRNFTPILNHMINKGDNSNKDTSCKNKLELSDI